MQFHWLADLHSNEHQLGGNGAGGGANSPAGGVLGDILSLSDHLESSQETETFRAQQPVSYYSPGAEEVVHTHTHVCCSLSRSDIRMAP